MASLSTFRTKVALLLLGAFSFLLAAPARGDELQYLPNGAFLVYSIDMSGFLKSKAFDLAKTEIKGFDDDMQKSLREEMGVLSANVGRLTMGVAGAGDHSVVIITTVKPITIADIKANRKPRSYQKDFTYKEVKVGAHKVYEENYYFQFDKIEDKGGLQTGQAFCVVEDKYIIVTQNMKSMQKILERDKKQAFSARVEAGLKETGLASTLTVVMDIDGFAQQERGFLLKALGQQLPGLDAVADGMQTFTLRIDSADKVKGLATLTCKNADSAGDLKKVGDAGLVAIKGLLKDDPKDSAEVQQAKKDVLSALGAVKLSAKGAQARAEATLDAAAAVSVVRSMMVVRTSKNEFKDEKK